MDVPQCYNNTTLKTFRVQFTSTGIEMRTRNKFKKPKVQFACARTDMRTRDKFRELIVQF
jgi:hypothetical protein